MPTATGQSAHSMTRWAWFDLWGGEAAFLWAVPFRGIFRGTGR